ncbi:hypothetical protein B0J18DRAFT_117296 [Chaetomium sp. MPI-SDFR-AT-0129]|nr:hypothetical protein B0J18DRAFT_117296 [Chaetomium sp. MPI-SDFR-AT-0129]
MGIFRTLGLFLAQYGTTPQPMGTTVTTTWRCLSRKCSGRRDEFHQFFQEKTSRQKQLFPITPLELHIFLTSRAPVRACRDSRLRRPSSHVEPTRAFLGARKGNSRVTLDVFDSCAGVIISRLSPRFQLAEKQFTRVGFVFPKNNQADDTARNKEDVYKRATKNRSSTSGYP